MGVDCSLGIKLINRKSKKEIELGLIPSRRPNDNPIADILYGQDICYTSIPLNIREILSENELSIWGMNNSEEGEFSESNMMSSEDALNILKKINDKIGEITTDCLLNDLKKHDLSSTDENSINEQKSLINDYFEFKSAFSCIYGILSVGIEIEYDVQFWVLSS